MSKPDDPLGRRSLFSAPDGGATGDPAQGDESGGRRALFSNPQVKGRSVIVTCRTCRARTPLSLPGVIRHLLPSAWLPLSPWSRWMRCPSCGTFSWCRVEWSHLITGR